MKAALVCLAVAVAVVGALPVRSKRGHLDHEEHGHGHATSYQNFNLESYHPVPVYHHHKHHESLQLADHGSSHGHMSAALSLSELDGGHDGHDVFAGLKDLGSLGGLGEGSYHRSALTDAADHGDDAYAHLGAAAVSEDADEGYEGHGSY